MKKAVRLYLMGSVQAFSFPQFIKDHAESNNVKGFVRKLEDGRAEIFLEGQSPDVEAMIEICKQGPKYSIIRGVEMKEEHLQDFKEFKIIKF